MLRFILLGLILFSCSVGDEGEKLSSPIIADAGGGHTCAVSGKGTLWCWGANDFGQLGVDVAEDHSRPVKAERVKDKNIHMVATGYAHTCAGDNKGILFCWGDNSLGQAGPVDLGKEQSAVAVAAGSSHTCAITVDKKLMCWGANNFGQLGNGTVGDKSDPVVVDLGEGRWARMVALGFSHSCALLDNNSVKCWGENSFGQLGDGSGIDRVSPVAVKLESGESVRSIVAGDSHTCAVLSIGALKCWGSNEQGQLKDGNKREFFAPIAVEWGGSDSVRTVVAGKNYTCMLNESGEVFCRGGNQYGQLGRESTLARFGVGRADLGSERRVDFLVAGEFHLCAVFQGHSLSCWGNNGRGQLGEGKNSYESAQHLEGDVNMVVTGRVHSCALPADGIPQCWGGNKFGQIGDGSAVDRHTPTSVNVGEGWRFTSIVSGCDHVCGILDDHSLACWGKNQFGQLGEEYDDFLTKPIAIDWEEGQKVVAVEAGCEHTCVMYENGSRVCRGEMSLEQSSQSAHFCKIRNGVFCEGRNERGQLGQRTPHRGDDRGEMGERMPRIELL